MSIEYRNLKTETETETEMETYTYAPVEPCQQLEQVKTGSPVEPYQQLEQVNADALYVPERQPVKKQPIKRQPKNYTNSIIYKIVCKNPEIQDMYIGSTTSLYNRISNHKRTYNQPKTQNGKLYLYQFIRKNGGFDNWQFIEIDKVKCTSKQELLKRERQYIDELKPTLNKNRPYITKKEKLKKDYEVCGIETSKNNFTKHTKTQKHLITDFIKNIYLELDAVDQQALINELFNSTFWSDGEDDHFVNTSLKMSNHINRCQESGRQCDREGVR